MKNGGKEKKRRNRIYVLWKNRGKKKQRKI